VGFIAKAATKKRVQPLSGPVNGALLGTPWLTTGAIPTGALVRSAVFALDLTGARSSSFRGHRSALASLLAPTSSSHLWVETSDFRSWDFVLGADNGRESIAADWSVQLSVGAEGARVATRRYLTKDDVLVHGEHHDALRDELLRAIALGRASEDGSEADITAASLRAGVTFQTPAPAPLTATFSIVTALDEAAGRQRLRLMGHRVVEDSPAGLRWGLGPAKNQASDYVGITFGPGELRGSAEVSSWGSGDRRIAVHALRKFVSRALFLVHGADDQAAYKGPQELQP
jgi:hypothetical protein